MSRLRSFGRAWLLAALVASPTVACGGASPAADATPFTDADCTATLVEVARMEALPAFGSSGCEDAGSCAGLAVGAGSLYFTTAYAPGCQGVACDRGGVAAVAVTGGAPQLVENGAPYALWSDGVSLVEATAGTVVEVPASGPPGAIVEMPPAASAEADAIDASFVYTATTDDAGTLSVTRTPRTGGAPAPLFTRSGAALFGMIDVGDALLVDGSWSSAEHVTRIPKDGSATSELPYDGVVSAVAAERGWGNAPGLRRVPRGQARLLTPGGLLVASVAIASPPSATASATSRVMLSSVDPGGAQVVACSASLGTGTRIVGLAADDTGTYVAYHDGSGDHPYIVVAKVP
jgi:hypothetical protein